MTPDCATAVVTHISPLHPTVAQSASEVHSPGLDGPSTASPHSAYSSAALGEEGVGAGATNGSGGAGAGGVVPPQATRKAARMERMVPSTPS